MENEIDNNAFIEDTLKAANEYLNHTTSVEEAITNKKAEYEVAKENFKLLWEAYNLVSKSRNKEQYEFNKVRIRLYLRAILVSLLSAFTREGAYEEIMNLHYGVSLSIKELKEEKELLNNIKSAIKELEKYQATDCNYDLSLLLIQLNNKNGLMFDILSEDIKSLKVRLKGIDYSSNTGKRNELKGLNESIEEKVQKLSLDHKY